MLVADFSNVPGFHAMGQATHVAAQAFQSAHDPTVRLTVVLANRASLKQQTGADLIHFNERCRSFVMVEYKAMEQVSDGAEFRWRDKDQFTEELSRMHQVLAELAKLPADAHPDSYRSFTNTFFLNVGFRSGAVALPAVHRRLRRGIDRLS